MAALTSVHLPSGWTKARGGQFTSYGITHTWSPGSTSCTLGICPAKSGRVRSLWLFVHGWRGFLVYKEGQGLRDDLIANVLGSASGRPEDGAVAAMIGELRSRNLVFA